MIRTLAKPLCDSQHTMTNKWGLANYPILLMVQYWHPLVPKRAKARGPSFASAHME